MPLDPALLKARWGLADASKDALVADVAATAQAFAERYTGRRFDLADDVEDFPRVMQSVQVRRYPIESITALWYHRNAQVPTDPPNVIGLNVYQLDAGKGLVWPGSGGTWPGLLRVEYRGGYATWPIDLTWAVTQIADILWAGTPGGGAPAGTVGGQAALKKLSVVGVYSAEYDSGGDAGGNSGDNTWGLVPPSATALLDEYRIAGVIGIG